MTIGILASGAYIPRLRLPRRASPTTNPVVEPGAEGPGQGRTRHLQLGRRRGDHGGGGGARCAHRRSIADRSAACTSHPPPCPFVDRLNAGIVAEALNLSAGVVRSTSPAPSAPATSALAQRALAERPDAGRGGGAAACQGGEPAGDALRRRRCALLVGRRRADRAPARIARGRWISWTSSARPEARLRLPGKSAGSATRVHEDRAAGARALLKSAGLSPAEVTHFCLPCTLSRVVPRWPRRRHCRGRGRDNLPPSAAIPARRIRC